MSLRHTSTVRWLGFVNRPLSEPAERNTYGPEKYYEVTSQISLCGFVKDEAYVLSTPVSLQSLRIEYERRYKNWSFLMVKYLAHSLITIW